eukprot:6270110-Pyramimonas_sp.AAC.1
MSHTPMINGIPTVGTARRPGTGTRASRIPGHHLYMQVANATLLRKLTRPSAKQYLPASSAIEASEKWVSEESSRGQAAPSVGALVRSRSFCSRSRIAPPLCRR